MKTPAHFPDCPMARLDSSELAKRNLWNCHCGAIKALAASTHKNSYELDAEEIQALEEFRAKRNLRLTAGTRVRVKNTAGFHKGAVGVIEYITPEPKAWVLRDNADLPVWYDLDELEHESRSL